MLTINDLKKMHDKAYTAGQQVREMALNDLVFYWVTQWDDNTLSQVQLTYKGEFNILRKAGRQIMADLRSNPVQVDFKPVDEDREDDADILDGYYRASCRENTSIEAFDNASSESVVCGSGAWELFTEYETKRNGDNKQVIKRKPIFEAPAMVLWDPNAKLADKSDAKFCSVLTAYSADAYKELVHELTGESIEDINPSSFKMPDEDFTFVWLTGQMMVFVVSFFHRVKMKHKIVTLVDPFGAEMIINADEFNSNMDYLIELGYEVIAEKTIEKWKVTKYIASGERILKSYKIPGGHIPVVPTYGERAVVKGVEYYEGVTRLSKDPQRLRNFQLSYLADIVSKSPRQKPLFYAEQIRGFEMMYEENGADNNYPYLLLNRLSPNGEQLPQGPAGIMPEQKVPDALIDSINFSRQAVEDVANPGLPQNIADPDLSGKAVIALQQRMDQQSIVYQQNMKHAKRRDAEIFATMASEIIDTPRKIVINLPDGQNKHVNMMESVIDAESGEIKTINDLSDAEFSVYADIGPSFQSRKEQTIDRLEKLIGETAQTDPAMSKILMLKLIKLMDGIDFEDVRKYATKQLVLMGIKEPETNDEKQWLAEASEQQDKPDPMMLAAQAEMQKAEAAKMREQRQATKDQADINNDNVGREIDAFNAETSRIKTQIDAVKANAEIKRKELEVFAKRFDAANKMRGGLQGRLTQTVQ